ncbi:epoxyqueuosine reductase [Natranaerovirga pectinivora]|uniref:Epoxyqueuosine reductase n=1 Tax=Natranaerovirga pectinivora TaxID=682400 RepID=A0A4R3MP06_9FIRM|nr:tRNA epoxyqueuosine(34) reductase QueG [Natranaerovirga pectinivora]TCT17015.1 epoxyqueuosine reductase [Natranaerovirga pectinivora]
MSTIKDKIIEYSKKVNIDMIGFCSAKPFYEYKSILEERKEKKYHVPFEEQDIDKRIYPELTLPGAKAFIVIGESYNVIPKAYNNQLTGKISISAIGKDYHQVVMEKLDLLERYIFSLQQCQIKKFVDISPLPDRQIAKRAGLGFFGKNSMLINSQYGSHFNIGYILTDLEIEPDTVEEYKGCSKCNRCFEVCPTNAIIGDGSLNCSICVAYLTQHKGDIPNELKEKMGTQLYGCDRCQKVCPYNQKIKNKLIEPILDEAMDLKRILSLSNKEFKELFGPTSAGWRGKKTIQRNAIICLGNTEDENAIDLLEAISNDDRKDIRKEVIWALSKKKNDKAIEVLNKMLLKENDLVLKGIIMSSLGG